ncbi:hypothetical protein [Sporomusa malonica]|uniref:hypothetical protein n=1 Tax=Sporomusa malonica TaxID=112901 RepID=UPI000A04DE83|nr:hypothetical protein [Sporomusa malonica]
MQWSRRFFMSAVYCIVTLIIVSCPTTSYALPEKYKQTDLPGLGRVVLPVQVEAVRVEEAQIPEYNLTINDGRIIHFVQVAITNEPKKFLEMDNPFFSTDADARKMTATIQKVLIQKAIKNGAKLINTYSIESTKIAGHEGWIGGYRTSIVEKMPSPMYTRIYLFNTQKKHMAMIYTCPDSDKTYWEPIMKQMVASLNSPVIIYRL